MSTFRYQFDIDSLIQEVILVSSCYDVYVYIYNIYIYINIKKTTSNNTKSFVHILVNFFFSCTLK